MAAMAGARDPKPVAVIRGTIDLLRERSGPALGERGASDLQDILDEVERLKRLTQTSSKSPAIAPSSARGSTSATLGTPRVPRKRPSGARCVFPSDSCRHRRDGGRLRQVFANLLSTPRGAADGEIELTAVAAASEWRVTVHDSGRACPPRSGCGCSSRS